MAEWLRIIEKNDRGGIFDFMRFKYVKMKIAQNKEERSSPDLWP